MRILFLTDNFPPEVNAPATRTFEHCKEWVKMGHEVTILTCHPNFPRGEVYEGYSNTWKRVEKLEGIKVIRIWTFITANKGFTKRIIDYISFGVMSFLHGIFIKADIIIGTSPQFFTAVSARWLSFWKRTPWVMEVRDLWPESIVAVGSLEKTSFIFKMLHGIEKSLYKSATKIVVVTNKFQNYIAKYVRNNNKIKVITNGVNLNDFPFKSKNETILKTLNIEKEKFIVGYIGTHGLAHGLDFILQNASRYPNIQFLFIGDGAKKQELLELKEHLELKNVSMLPFVSKEEIKEYISIIDVSLVNLKKSDTFKTVIPSKIFENAAMQKPILLGVEGEAQEIIEKYNAGVCYVPEDIVSFNDALNKVLIKENYKEFQKGCLTLAKNYNRENLALQMLEFIQDIPTNAN